MKLSSHASGHWRQASLEYFFLESGLMVRCLVSACESGSGLELYPGPALSGFTVVSAVEIAGILMLGRALEVLCCASSPS